jgi:hypothetical protein
MKRRRFLKQVAIAAMTVAGPLARRSLFAAEEPRAVGGKPALALDAALRRDWLERWEKNILGDSRNRYCDKEMGEELGWLVSPLQRRPRPADGQTDLGAYESRAEFLCHQV